MNKEQSSGKLLALIKFFFEARVATFFATIISVFFIFYFGLLERELKDPIPKLNIIDTKAKEEFGSFATKVNVGAFVKNFTKFDVAANEFIVDINLWFEFNSDQVMLSTISKFSFDNGDILRKSEPKVILSETRTLAKYDVRVSFKSDLFYKQFPLEDHRISLILSNNFVSPAEMYFELEDASFKAAENMFVPDWDIVDLETRGGFLELGLDQNKTGLRRSANPKVVFTINLKKQGGKDAFIIFVPLFLATFIAIYSFMTPLLGSNLRFITSSSAVPALLGYRFVLQNLIPKVAYFTVTDKIYLMLLIISFFIFIFQSLLIRYAERINKSNQVDAQIDFLKKVSTVVFFVIMMLLIFGSYYFVILKG